MTLNELNERWKIVLGDPSSPALAGLVYQSEEDYQALKSELNDSVNGDLNRLIFKIGLNPAAAVVVLSRAAMQAYGDNFWQNFCDEIGVDVPISRRGELTEAFCHAAEYSIPGFERANWSSWKFAGEFLAQAGLPLHHCAKFAQVLRHTVDETGLPAADDQEGIAETIRNMLDRSDLVGQKVIQTALSGPAGPLILTAALSAIVAGDYSHFNPTLAKALKDQFESLPSRTTSQALRRPFFRLDRDIAGLEICCPHPPRELCGVSGIVWSVNGSTYRVPQNESLIVPVTKMAMFRIELAGLSSGRTITWSLDSRLFNYPAGIVAFSHESLRFVSVDCSETSDNGLSLPAGEYWLLHEPRWRCDQAICRNEWNELNLTLSQVNIRPGSTAVFYDDAEGELSIGVSKAIWIETEGSIFTTTEDAVRIQFDWKSWPNVWLPAELNPAHWSAEISSHTWKGEGSLIAQDDCVVGGLKRYKIVSKDGISQLFPGLHRITLTLWNGKQLRHKQEWLVWAGLSSADSGQFRWALEPRNIVTDALRGFCQNCSGLDPDQTTDRLRQIVFQLAAEQIVLRWIREGITLESCQVSPGTPGKFTSHNTGESFAADEHSKLRLRVSVVPAIRVVLFVNDRAYKEALSVGNAVRIDVSLASLAALHNEGGRITIKVDEDAPLLVARFTRPTVALRATIQSVPREGNKGLFKQMLLLLGSQVTDVRLHVRELISGFEAFEEGEAPRAEPAVGVRPCLNNPFESLDNFFDRPSASLPTEHPVRHLWINIPQLPAIKCVLGRQKKIDSDSGWEISVSVPVERWPVGAWIVELETRSDFSTQWETVLDRKGGRLPILIVQIPMHWGEDYRTRALWWSIANASSGGANLPQLPEATGNEIALLSLLCEINSFLRTRISDQAWIQFESLSRLRVELSRHVNRIMETGNEQAAVTMVQELNREATTATPRSILLSSLSILALPSQYLVNVVENGDALRTALRWCGLLAQLDSVSNGFFRIDLDPCPTIGIPCANRASILGHFSNCDQLGPNAIMPSGEELSGFHFGRYFGELERASLSSNFSPATIVPLSPDHFKYAVLQFRMRRSKAEECSSLSNVNTVFSKAATIVRRISELVPSMSKLMPQTIWQHPWPEVSLESDNLTETIIQFASVYALAARLSGEQRLSFRDLNGWLRTQPWIDQQPQAINQAVTTLLCQGPEIYGFFLMFWELMLKTYPHD